MGPHTRNPRLGFARYRALLHRKMETGAEKVGALLNRPRMTTKTGAEKVEALLNRPRMTTNRGAGSVSGRGQLWRPNELGVQRMTRSLYGRGWRRFLNQVGSRAYIGV